MGNQLGRTWKRIRKKVEDEKDTGSAFVCPWKRSKEGRKEGGTQEGCGPEAVFTILGLGIEAKDLQSAQIYLDTSKHCGIWTDFWVEWSLVLHYIVVEEWIKRWLKLKVLKMNGCDARAEGRLVLVLWFFRLVGRGEARALGVCVCEVCVGIVQGVMEM